MRLSQLGLYWRTLRHLRAEQLIFLLWRRVLRQPRVVTRPDVNRPNVHAARQCLLPLSNPVWLGGLRFRFLNHARDFSERIDWVSAGESRLWQYNLHYFDWLRQVDFPPEQVLEHIGEWIAANPPFRGSGWEPYPSSLRLVNWLGALAALPPEAVPRSVIESIGLQAAWLEANIEYQLGANHLFVNLKALLFAGAFLGEGYGRALAARVGTRFLLELNEQFLSDGGHYERSPMYHAILTQDLLELRALSRGNNSFLPPEVELELERTCIRAVCFAASMQPPDDSVFLFNDAAANIAPRCSELLEFARRVLDVELPPQDSGFRSQALPASGYFVAGREGDMVVFDCGEVGPAHQPGHAHCDTLSFELFLDGRRVITNAGNFDYIAGPERSHARSTRAHNTVVVDGQEQSEIWGAFRVGRRASPLYATFESGPDGVEFRGAHDGYRRLPGSVTHSRTARVSRDFTIHLIDELEGGDEHEAESWLHLAVGLRFQQGSSVFEALDEEGRTFLRVEPGEGLKSQIVQTPRYPEFGLTSTGDSLRMTMSGRLPHVMCCQLVPVRDKVATYR
jgi:uncharacterized heparinase superfamily protein